jgi:hypothetical protein
MRRHERAIYIGVGTAFSPIPAVWLEPGVARPVFHVAVAAYVVVAVLGNITAIKLALQVHRRLREKDPVPERSDAPLPLSLDVVDDKESPRVESHAHH